MTYKTFQDSNGNEMSFWINNKNQIYIEIKQVEDPYMSQYITIDKEDAQELVDDLQLLTNNLE